MRPSSSGAPAPNVFLPPVVSQSAKLTLFDGQLSISWLTIVTIPGVRGHHAGPHRCLPAAPRWARPCGPARRTRRRPSLWASTSTHHLHDLCHRLRPGGHRGRAAVHLPSLTPTTGSMPGIKAFTAAVFGGIGSIPGALLGGLLLGVMRPLPAPTSPPSCPPPSCSVC